MSARFRQVLMREREIKKVDESNFVALTFQRLFGCYVDDWYLPNTLGTNYVSFCSKNWEIQFWKLFLSQKQRESSSFSHLLTVQKPNFKARPIFFFKWAIPWSLLLYFRLFNLANVQYKGLSMTGFEVQTSGIGSDRSTTALRFSSLLMI